MFIKQWNLNGFPFFLIVEVLCGHAVSKVKKLNHCITTFEIFILDNLKILLSMYIEYDITNITIKKSLRCHIKKSKTHTLNIILLNPLSIKPQTASEWKKLHSIKFTGTLSQALLSQYYPRCKKRASFYVASTHSFLWSLFCIPRICMVVLRCGSACEPQENCCLQTPFRIPCTRTACHLRRRKHQ